MYLSSFENSSLTCELLRSVLFNFHVFRDFFVVVFLLLNFSLILLLSENIVCVIAVALNLLRHYYYYYYHCLEYGLSWECSMLPEKKKMCILLLFGGIFWIYLFDPIGIVLFKTSISLLIFHLVVLSFIQNGKWKSPAIIIVLPISPFNSVNGSSYYDAFLKAQGGCIYAFKYMK